jgi:hypothetical protein
MKTAPLRFEILLNGRRLAVTGIEKFGVLSTVISWVRRNPANLTAEKRREEGFDELQFLREICEIEFGGLDSAADRSLFWGRESLRAGDEVTIRVLPPGEYDEPKTDA